MIKLYVTIILIFFSTLVQGREIGQTEITAEDGIEVFQDEKFYLLKKNVKIESDNFILLGDIVKIFFDKDLNDIKTIDANGNVSLESAEYKLRASGTNVFFILAEEEIIVEGMNSLLIIEDTEMYSDGKIKVNNIDGSFNLAGNNSKLKSENNFIEGKSINGSFSSFNKEREVSSLNVFDEKLAYLKTNGTEMFANKITYNKESALFELEDNVKIKSETETITGDYGTLDTITNSYKIKSKNSKRVKVLISDTDE